MFAAIVPVNSVGRWGTHAICCAPRVEVDLAQVDPAAADLPALGSARRISSRAIVLLPAPLAPTSAVISPGAISRSMPCTTSPLRSG